MVYLGVDLHRKHSVVTALAEDGTVLLSRRIASAPEPFRRVFGELEPWSLSVAFDHATVADRATFDEPPLAAVGVSHVLVNGVFSVRDGELTDQRAGRLLTPS